MTNIKKTTILLAIFLLTLTACSTPKKEQTTENREQIVSNKVELSEKYEQVHDIVRQSDGSVRVGVSDKNGKNSRIFESNDDGKSWSKVATLDAKVNLSDKDVLFFYLGVNHEVFFRLTKDATNYLETFHKSSEYYSMDAKEELSKLDIPLKELLKDENQAKDQEHNEMEATVNSVSTASYTSDGDLLVEDFDNRVYLLDAKSSEIKQTYSLPAEVENVAGLFADDKYVYVYGSNGFFVFDKASGKQNESLPIEKKITDIQQKAQGESVAGVSIYQPEENGNIFISNRMGVYEFNQKKDTSKQLFNFSTLDQSLANQYGYRFIALSDDQLLYAITQESNQQTLYLGKIAKKSANAKKEKNKLTIWSLKPNPDLTNALDIFKNKYPDYTAIIENGLEDTNTQNTSDAINKLNTRLTAGEGPDVILLDGLPVDTYIEKGSLVDLKSLYNELSKNEKFFSKVVEAYQKDNRLYAIPQSFSYTSIVAKKNLFSQVNNADNLLAYLEKNSSKDMETEMLAEVEFFEILYYATFCDWMKQDKIDQDRLKAFFESCKKYHEVLNLHEPENINFTKNANELLMTGNAIHLEEELSKSIALDFTGSSYGLATLQNLQKSDFETGVFNDNHGKIFIPNGILGINKKTKNMEAAKDFLRFSLASESSPIAGIPVNQNKLKNELAEETTANSEELIKFLEELEKPVDKNTIISSAVIEQLEAYLFSGESLDTAVRNVAKKVDLYMSE